MKFSKELKYNCIVIVVLIMMDLLWDQIGGRNSENQFQYPLIFLQFTFDACFILIYAVNYLYFAPRFLIKKKLFLYGFSFIFMMFLFAGTRYLLEEVIYYHFTGLHNYKIENPNLLATYSVDSFYYTLRFCLYSSVVYLLFRYVENKEQIHQLKLEHQKAQLATLRSQISPHFLFNTLNNFYEELYDDKPETANDILKLSQLLRYVTYETSQETTTLKKEIEFINTYLHFFRRRYEATFYVNFTIEGTISNQAIPTLILIHFIENVCKHGVINDVNRPAKIDIKISANSLQINTENAINKSHNYMEHGIGTKNIKKRLHVIYNDNYSLQYQKNETTFKSTLTIPI